MTLGRQEDVKRETFIALRARRQAYRVATDILYGRAVDVRGIECPACHSRLQPSAATHEIAVCGACGQHVLLPSHLKLKPNREVTPSELAALAEDERLAAEAEAEAARAERRLIWFWIIAVAAVVIALFFGVYVFRSPA